MATDPVTGVIVGASTLANFMDRGSSSSGSQTQSKAPYPRDFSTQQIWDQYMSRVLGSSAYPMLNMQYPANAQTGQPQYNIPISLASILDRLAYGKSQGGTIGNLAASNPGLMNTLGVNINNKPRKSQSKEAQAERDKRRGEGGRGR